MRLDNLHLTRPNAIAEEVIEFGDELKTILINTYSFNEDNVNKIVKESRSYLLKLDNIKTSGQNAILRLENIDLRLIKTLTEGNLFDYVRDFFRRQFHVNPNPNSDIVRDIVNGLNKEGEGYTHSHRFARIFQLIEYSEQVSNNGQMILYDTEFWNIVRGILAGKGKDPGGLEIKGQITELVEECYAKIQEALKANESRNISRNVIIENADIADKLKQIELSNQDMSMEEAFKLMLDKGDMDEAMYNECMKDSYLKSKLKMTTADFARDKRAQKRFRHISNNNKDIAARYGGHNTNVSPELRRKKGFWGDFTAAHDDYVMKHSDHPSYHNVSKKHQYSDIYQAKLCNRLVLQIVVPKLKDALIAAGNSHKDHVINRIMTSVFTDNDIPKQQRPVAPIKRKRKKGREAGGAEREIANT